VSPLSVADWRGLLAAAIWRLIMGGSDGYEIMIIIVGSFGLLGNIVNIVTSI
jgi:hypothetical protein